MSYGYYTGLTELILAFRSTYLYFGSYTYIIELILALRNLYWSYGTYTGISEHILVFRILYVYYRIYTCISDLIQVLQSIYLYFGSYSCMKVPVGTISQNISESYHIQGQIRLIQIRTLVLRRYRSHQIHIQIQNISQNKQSCRFISESSLDLYIFLCL